MHRSATRVAILLLVPLLLAVTACGDDDDVASTGSAPETTETTTSGTSSSTTPATTSATTAPVSSTTDTVTDDVAMMSTVNVYWAWTIPTIANGTPERLGAGGRAASGETPAESAMEALLSGPDATETEIGMASEIPADTELLAVEIDGGTATVDLSSEFETPSGTLSETMRTAQVVFTLTQFDEVDDVAFRIDGEDRDAIGSHGLDVSGGVDRDDFVDVRPFILVEQPYPGAEIEDSIELSGESNTFEATVQWTVTDADGLIIEEGFTTATAGNGTWGRFDETIDVPTDLEGRGAVIVWEMSAEDGSQLNVVEYPVQF